MSELFQAMALPFTACLLLVGIHVYLGIHIIARKVIFVDLALAQIAALGAIWGVLLGYGFHEDPWIVKAFSLLFTILGALLFSMTRPRDRRVPHEAIIGITYAVALAATILASSHLPHGSDEIRDLLAGSILWVEGHTLAITGLLYLGIGGFHLLFRRQFFELSFREEGLAGPLERERLWDFLFYFSFGLVVTSSVAIAGVLLVFSYLVIPALIGVLLAPTLRARLAVGWGVGSLMSLVGVTVSYRADLPSGPTIVVCLAASLIAAGMLHLLRTNDRPWRALAHHAAVILLGALALGGTLLLRRSPEGDLLALLEDPVAHNRLVAVERIATDPHLRRKLVPSLGALLTDEDADVRAATVRLVGEMGDAGLHERLHPLLADPDEDVREAAIDALRRLEDPRAAAALAAAASREEDEYLRVQMGEAILELGDRRGVRILIEVIDGAEAAQARHQAWRNLGEHLAIPFPFDAELSPQGNDAMVRPILDWWQRSAPLLRWNPVDRRFHPGTDPGE